MDHIEYHLSDEDLESYSLGRSPSPLIAAVEQHLLICGDCLARIEAIEPYSFVHYTNDGPFYERITKLITGGFFARHWCQGVLDGGRGFDTQEASEEYLTASFRQMFPEHICTARCGPTHE